MTQYNSATLGNFLSLFYSLSRGIETTRNALQEYEKHTEEGIPTQNGEMTEQVINEFISMITKKYNSQIPPQYATLLNTISSMPWSQAVDIISAMAKEFGKDKQTGEYRPTKQVMEDTVYSFLRSKFLDALMRGD